MKRFFLITLLVLIAIFPSFSDTHKFYVGDTLSYSARDCGHSLFLSFLTSVKPAEKEGYFEIIIKEIKPKELEVKYYVKKNDSIFLWGLYPDFEYTYKYVKAEVMIEDIGNNTITLKPVRTLL